MRGFAVGVFARAVSCALSFVLATGPVFANAAPVFASEPVAAAAEAPAVTVETSPTVVSEDVSKRTENSNHFLLSDGTYRAEIHAGDINYENEAGDLVPIDTSLVPGPDPGEWQTKAAAVVAEFGAERPAEAPVAISSDTWRVSFDMLGVSENAKLTYGNRARYLGVATDTDLEYESLADGIKETVVLNSADAPYLSVRRQEASGAQRINGRVRRGARCRLSLRCVRAIRRRKPHQGRGGVQVGAYRIRRVRPRNLNQGRQAGAHTHLRVP